MCKAGDGGAFKHIEKILEAAGLGSRASHQLCFGCMLHIQDEYQAGCWTYSMRLRREGWSLSPGPPTEAVRLETQQRGQAAAGERKSLGWAGTAVSLADSGLC